MHELLQIIQRIEVFHGLDDAQLQKLIQIAQREVYHASDVIIEQDSPGDSLYIIAAGQVEILQRDASGAMQTILFLGEGQVFGELALLDGGPRTATVVADDDPTVVYSLKRADFDSLCRADSALGYRVMRNLALDLAFKLRHRNLDK